LNFDEVVKNGAWGAFLKGCPPKAPMPPCRTKHWHISKAGFQTGLKWVFGDCPAPIQLAVRAGIGAMSVPLDDPQKREPPSSWYQNFGYNILAPLITPQKKIGKEIIKMQGIL
jgi:hypothetical protein